MPRLSQSQLTAIRKRQPSRADIDLLLVELETLRREREACHALLVPFACLYSAGDPPTFVGNLCKAAGEIIEQQRSQE